jgi:type 1 fimbria pilin
MKKVFFFVFLLVLIAGTAAAVDRGHVYIYGTVDDLGDQETILSGVDEPQRTVRNKTITISGTTYILDPKCEVMIVYQDKGASHKRPARQHDIRRGDSVAAKTIGTTIYAVEIAR